VRIPHRNAVDLWLALHVEASAPRLLGVLSLAFAMQSASPVPFAIFFSLALAAIVCAVPVPVRAGPLKDIEDTASPPPSDRRHDERTEPSGGGDTGGDTGDEVERDAEGAGWRILGFILLMPWTVPRLLVDQPCAGGFAAYPYADGRGNVRHDARLGGCALAPVEPIALRRWAMQTDLEGGYAWPSVAGATLAARVQLPYRIEFGGRFSFLRDLQEEPREQALHGTAHMAVRFAQAPRVELRTGAGVRAFSLDRPLYGFDLMYGMDVFGKRPIVGRVELHIGTLGHAAAGEARLTLGYMLGKVELYAGYNHIAFWNDAGTTRLTGPVAGLRAWF
jgi:hypothetical protein